MTFIKATLGALVLVLAGIIAAPAYAQVPSGGARAMATDTRRDTVEGAIQRYLSQDADAARLFDEAGFEYRRLLIVHRLPSQDRLLAEVELGRGASALRYPLRLEDVSASQNGSNWRVDWAPEPAYTRALIDAVGEQKLARSEAGQPWTEIQRLPAFPIIVGSGFFVTPYGRVVPEPVPEDPAQPGALAPPADLKKHAQRWTGMLLQDDPGAANVDLILAEGVSWESATQALLPAAMVGLFRVYFVSMHAEVPRAFSAVAPVFKKVLTADSTLFIGVSAISKTVDEPRSKVRLRVGQRGVEALQEKQEGCPDDATFCVSSAQEFNAMLAGRAQVLEAARVSPAYVMVAGSADVFAQEMLRYLASSRNIFDLPIGKIMVGYIAPQP